ncbi:MAG: 2-phospho-L-lactate guanylyltransferase [Friedmanniella sp.]|jgi:2-phospho-L-lactate/phosphoenolpyruvate guanylyltransferase
MGGSTAAVVALKPVTHAKSRLDTVPDPLRRRLAWTMAVDTLTALAATVAEVLVVSDQPALASRLARAGVRARVVGEAGAEGMNGALARGARLLNQAGHARVLASVGDLPALRPASVRTVLAASPAEGRYYLADASGIGTTMLIAGGVGLDPHFQGGSAAAHARSGAEPLTDAVLASPVPDARADVDTEADLVPAAALGIGAATAALLVPGSAHLAEYSVVTTTGYTDARQRPLVVTAAGHRLVLPTSSLADGLRDLRPGQRLHSVHTEGVVRSAWL